MQTMTDPRYPIGKFQWNGLLSDTERAQCLDDIAAAPAKLRAAIAALRPEQYEQSYREGGYSARQLAHHLVDGDIAFYTRVKLALTEERPLVKTFEEDLWAVLPDYFSTPVEVSVRTFELLRERWMHLLRAMKPADFQREYLHPSDPQKPRPIEYVIAYAAWHGLHHVAHVELVKNRQ
jgi:uncharacterized damage-inducible protein DinB